MATVEERHRESAAKALGCTATGGVGEWVTTGAVEEAYRRAGVYQDLCRVAQALADAEQRGAESAKAEAQPAGTGWVDCADRMPPTGCSVIVDGGAGYFDGIEWRTLMGTAEHRPITWTVTHWMPWPKLPPPPERDR